MVEKTHNLGKRQCAFPLLPACEQRYSLFKKKYIFPLSSSFPQLLDATYIGVTMWCQNFLFSEWLCLIAHEANDTCPWPLVWSRVVTRPP